MLFECVPCPVHMPFCAAKFLIAEHLPSREQMSSVMGPPRVLNMVFLSGSYLQGTTHNKHRNVTCWVRWHPCPPWANGGMDEGKTRDLQSWEFSHRPVGFSPGGELKGKTQPGRLLSYQMLCPQQLGGDMLLGHTARWAPGKVFWKVWVIGGGITKEGQACCLLHMQDWEGPRTFVRRQVVIAVS